MQRNLNLRTTGVPTRNLGFAPVSQPVQQNDYGGGTNIQKYMRKFGMNEQQFQADVPRLMMVLGISTYAELEYRISDLL